MSVNASADTLANALVGSDSLPLPVSGYLTVAYFSFSGKSARFLSCQDSFAKVKES